MLETFTREQLPDQFAEGVKTTLEEQHVIPEQIEDGQLREQYAAVVAAKEAYEWLLDNFQETLDKI